MSPREARLNRAVTGLCILLLVGTAFATLGVIAGFVALSLVGFGAAFTYFDSYA